MYRNVINYVIKYIYFLALFHTIIKVVNYFDFFVIHEYDKGMSIEQILGELGLKDKEAKIYTTLLSLGETTAYDIAKKSGIKRPTVYVVLEELRDKNIVLKKPHPKKQLYVARDPKVFIHESLRGLDTKKEQARALLPKLDALLPKDFKPGVLYFEGFEGIGQSVAHLAQFLKDSEEVVAFFTHITGPDSRERVDRIYRSVRKFYAPIAGAGATIRCILTNEPYARKLTEKVADEFGWTLRYVPETAYSSKVTVLISKRCVAIISSIDNQHVVIESEHFASMQRQVFDYTWDALANEEV